MKKIIIIFTVIFIFILACSEKKDIIEANTHPQNWTNSSSEQFHGEAVVESGNESCKSCHGTDFMGGTSSISCYSTGCHAHYPHPGGFMEVSSDNFHGLYLKNNTNWNMDGCKGCHGSAYYGGSSGYSCRECHTGTNGPEECNTCHGSSVNNAPPRDRHKNVLRSAVGVGLHQEHVAEVTVAVNFACNVCHPNLTGFDDPNHIDDTSYAQIEFSSLVTQNGRLNPVWDRNSETCNSMYCHGSFIFRRSESQHQEAYRDSIITGRPYGQSWTPTTVVGRDCGYCHDLPPTGHVNDNYTVTDCGNAACHSSVVDNNGEIKSLDKHINGQADR